MPSSTPSINKSAGIISQFKEIILFLIGIIIVTVIFGLLIFSLKDASHSVILPMISILGIVSLLLCLSGISYVFVRVNLDDKKQALGLPPGSIQAVIALSLIVLFAILSVFVLTTMGDAGLRKLSVSNAGDRDSQVAKLGTAFAGWEDNGKGVYTIFVRDSLSTERNDVGKQLIVLIGTLMTSAVSFYFGTRATVAGKNLGVPENRTDVVPAGPRGSEGPTGATGATGAEGTRGAEQNVGATGATGAATSIGVTGAAGAAI
ncbi:hypothetical protein [Methylobacterium sp. Gmos1]